MQKPDIYLHPKNEENDKRTLFKGISPSALGIDYIKDKRPTIAVIIPTLNEAENLPLILPYLPMNWIDEVFLIDGRSTDNTVEVAKQLLPSIKVILEKRKGKGIAMRTGYEASSSDILIVMDADGSNDPREIPRFVTALLEGADFVKGSRFAPGGGTTDMPQYRKFGNGFFVLLSNLLFGTNFTDLCYGYHAFWRYCLNTIVLKDYSGFEIDTALYLQAVRSKLRIVDIPSFEGYRFYGKGKLQTIPDGSRVLKTILQQWVFSLVEKDPEMTPGFRGIKYARPNVFTGTPSVQARTILAHRLSEFVQLLGIMIFSGEDKQNIMRRTLRIALEASGADSGSLILVDEKGDVSEGCLISENEFIDSDQSPWIEILDKGVAGWAIKNRQPVLVLDTQDDSRWLQRDWDKFNRSALALPLSVGGIVIGALTLIRPETNRFTEDDLKTMEIIATDS
ncbi:MAG: glycosyltransferase [Desulfobacteraceae bacterium]|nr:glycosyltransferase [Desulfobacteraceae bacterium]